MEWFCQVPSLFTSPLHSGQKFYFHPISPHHPKFQFLKIVKVYTFTVSVHQQTIKSVITEVNNSIMQAMKISMSPIPPPPRLKSTLDMFEESLDMQETMARKAESRDQTQVTPRRNTDSEGAREETAWEKHKRRILERETRAFYAYMKHVQRCVKGDEKERKMIEEDDCRAAERQKNALRTEADIMPTIFQSADRNKRNRYPESKDGEKEKLVGEAAIPGKQTASNESDSAPGSKKRKRSREHVILGFDDCAEALSAIASRTEDVVVHQEGGGLRAEDSGTKKRKRQSAKETRTAAKTAYMSNQEPVKWWRVGRNAQKRCEKDMARWDGLLAKRKIYAKKLEREENSTNRSSDQPLLSPNQTNLENTTAGQVNSQGLVRNAPTLQNASSQTATSASKLKEELLLQTIMKGRLSNQGGCLKSGTESHGETIADNKQCSIDLQTASDSGTMAPRSIAATKKKEKASGMAWKAGKVRGIVGTHTDEDPQESKSSRC